MMLIVAAGETQRGWGGPIALVVACGIFWLFVVVHRKITNPSPTPPAQGGVKAIGAGRTGFTPTGDTATRRPDPTRRPTDPRVDTGPPPRGTEPRRRDTGGSSADPTDDTAWYGRIVEAGGRRFRAAAHIARTGDSPPPEPVRDDFDDALDLVEPIDLDEWLGWAAGLGYNERVRRGVARFGISESSVKRRIRDLRDESED